MKKELLKPVVDKYGYNENEQNALIYALDAMISVYGENEIPSLIQLLIDVPIYFLDKIESGTSESIRYSEMCEFNKKIITVEEINPYGKTGIPSSWYGCQTIFDENMQPIGHKRWIGIKDMKGFYNKDKYLNMFGTTVNIPYLIHELNHAYAMQNPLIEVMGDSIIEKKGMFITKSRFTKDGDKYILREESSEDILLEEAINEFLTQKMLVNKIGVEDYKAVDEQLKSIGHVPSSYSAILMSVARNLYYIFGDRLMSYRKDNDMSFIEEFNSCIMQTEIGKKYYEGKDPYEVLSEYAKKSFLLTCECFHYSFEDYGRMQGKIAGELYGPLFALLEYKGEYSLEEYDKYRESKGLSTAISR